MKIDLDKVEESKFVALCGDPYSLGILNSFLTEHDREEFIISRISIRERKDKEDTFYASVEVILKKYIYTFTVSLWEHLFPAITSKELKKKILQKYI